MSRLSREKSPYLLQHAGNPVDWYPWGAEALARARAEHKPIFLSIGYSTCHWCHVMERESFENPEIAALLNRSFVCIKVDREEHPDLDQIYMAAVTAMTGQGGWPLTVFLTPDLKPFFGGTYFPPERRGHMAGMRELVPAVARAWETRRQELIASAEELTAAIRDHAEGPDARPPLDPALLGAAFREAAATFDAVSGGFGGAPKFPRSPELSFLLRYWAGTREPQALTMVTSTLDHLARGGIHDQLGGGFHRYATDERWLVPHFEKMLSDQALLARTYCEAYRITREARYGDVARGIFEYVLRDLSGPEGEFFSAEDADSEGEEGRFYVWSLEEVLDVLGRADGALVARTYGVTPEGNFEGGRSILHLAQPPETPSGAEVGDPAALERLAVCRRTLLEARGGRVRPHRDDKVLTSWNGLMIAAYAYGGATLEEPRYLEAARRSARFVLRRLSQEGGLLRRYRDGEARYAGTLEDYAFFVDGLIELYEATFEAEWLAEARRLGEEMIRRFQDQGGGFVLRDRADDPLIIEAGGFADSATPSGNAMAALGLLRVGRLTAGTKLEQAAQAVLEAAAPSLVRAPFAHPQMFIGLDFALGPTREVVIAGAPGSPETRRLIRAVQERFLPRTVTLLHPDDASAAGIEALAPFIKAQGPIDGRPAAYLCERFVCKLPTTDVTAFVRLLEADERQPEGARQDPAR